MRALTSEELELIGGGQNSSPDDREEIVVWGTSNGSGWGGGGFSIPGGGGGGTPGEDTGHQQMETPNPTPCVQATPSGVDLTELNGMAKWLGDELNGLSQQNNTEWGAFIYKDATNGQLYETDPFGGTNHDSLSVTVGLPQGATIEGYIHTHPTGTGEDQRELSNSSDAGPGNDVDAINALIATGHADPNMIAYVNTTYDQNGGAPNATYAYDANHRVEGSDNPGCHV